MFPPTRKEKKTTKPKKSKEKGIHVGKCKQILIVQNNNDVLTETKIYVGLKFMITIMAQKA